MSDVKHTPTPWTVHEISHGRGLSWSIGRAETGPYHTVARVLQPNNGRSGDSEANARFIVTAVNSHARLIEALEAFAEFARNNTDEHGWAGTRCEGERINDWFGPSDFRRAAEATAQAREDGE